MLASGKTCCVGSSQPPEIHPFCGISEGAEVKLFRLGPPRSERPAVLADDGRLLDLSGLTADLDGAFLSSGGIDKVRTAVAAGLLPELDPAGLRIGAPVARPGKVV